MAKLIIRLVEYLLGALLSAHRGDDAWYWDRCGSGLLGWCDDEDGPLCGLGEEEEGQAWLCICGHYEESGFHCSYCGNEPPWGCDCGFCEERDRDEWLYLWENYPGELLDFNIEGDAVEREEL